MSRRNFIEMDDIKNKFLNLIHKQRDVKIPTMGFSEHFVSLVPDSYSSRSSDRAGEDDDPLAKHRFSDQEILESIEDVYFDESADHKLHELNKLCESGGFDAAAIERSMQVLKQQHKVISKKVLQLILEKRSACNEEFVRISETEKVLQESVWTCQKARSYLNYARTQLTTTSLEILASYRKREVILDLLKVLNALRRIKLMDETFQRLLAEDDYAAAIELLLECKSQTERFKQYQCIESVAQKIQDTLILTEVQLDEVLSGLTLTFDRDKYTKLQAAYRLLGKSLIAMDQLHMNFISTIHATAFGVLRSYLPETSGEERKPIFEQLCESIPSDRYIASLIDLCKNFWRILVCYHQITIWHQNAEMSRAVETETEEDKSNAEYVQEKLKKGQYRIWNDIQAKICVYLSSSKIHQLKYEHFIQALSIGQRLKKVGLEFCEEPSEKLIEHMKRQSVEFFKRYHSSCLEEIGLFMDHEAWVSIGSFSGIVQLQEYKTVKRALQRHKLGQKVSSDHKVIPLLSTPTSTATKKASPPNDNDSSMSQDESSIYGSCGYFLRFSEKSSPFDGGFDETMLEEDILAGIADESCYYSGESGDDQDYNGDQQADDSAKSSAGILSNTSLTVLRCIGRYLQMCRLLHSISPQIVLSMTELIEYYVCAVHEMFSKDLPVPGENLYTPLLAGNMRRILTDVVPKAKRWPPSFGMIESDLGNPEQLFGLAKRVVAVESCVTLLKEFGLLRGYLEHLLITPEAREPLQRFFEETPKYIVELRKPVYMCVTARAIDLQAILIAMTKTKWDTNHVTVQHSAYIDSINRGIQLFAMRLEEISATLQLPKEALWDNLAHILTHMLVEGFSNAKKCSTGGRALMQLDITHFTSILELISGLKFPQHFSYVEQYVKAYYLPKDLLEEWIKEQKTTALYSNKQLIGLITCACSNDKKMRQKLLALVENSTSPSAGTDDGKSEH